MNWTNPHMLLNAPLLPVMAIFPGVALLTARRTRPDLFFSITVEPSLRDSDTGRAILRQFSRTVILFSLIGLAATVSGGFAGLTPALGVALIVVGAVLEFGGMITAYATARRRVIPYHVEQSREREVVVKRTRPVGGWLGQLGPCSHEHGAKDRAPGRLALAGTNPRVNAGQTGPGRRPHPG